jgi:hypothetical protein
VRADRESLTPEPAHEEGLPELRRGLTCGAKSRLSERLPGPYDERECRPV